MEENEIAAIVLDKAIRVHKALGPGLLESAYEVCLAFELEEEGLKVERQKELPLYYRGLYMDVAYRVDLMIEGKFIVELKAVKEVTDLHFAQTLSYLKLSGCKLGCLINFHVPLLKNGFRRVVNEL